VELREETEMESTPAIWIVSEATSIFLELLVDSFPGIRLTES
jgi:hypothetical protein